MAEQVAARAGSGIGLTGKQNGEVAGSPADPATSRSGDAFDQALIETSSKTKLVWAEESSVAENFNVTDWPL